ncbi:hypothetical protein [Streptomyces albipurpureus]|uniref:Guanylate cyclase domain-containing protein n=1 Tax=Streptomyces albipurpureus TaxID=2897419 RepID=A0ABT0UKT0_9ACTN|nr:hypothetical protein [Streptomyces sp. CWNU-1]MCM2388836.1 hypothetical protein [Streptomyces sp. CWNU-1]
MGAGAVYKFLMSVDARGSGRYLDNAKLRMRRRIYAWADDAFDSSGIGRALIHREDRGDGFIAAVDARVPPAQLIGPWLAELYQGLRDGNEELSTPLGLRVGMHVGPVQHDDDGMAGEAVDQVCRLADSDITRDVLAHSGRDLVCVVSDSLYLAVVKHGGRFMEPSTYRPARLMLKEGPVTAWFHIPGETRPAVPGDATFGKLRGADAAPGPRRAFGPSTDPQDGGEPQAVSRARDIPGGWSRASRDGAGDDSVLEAAPDDTEADRDREGARVEVHAEGDSIFVDRGDFRYGTTHFGGRHTTPPRGDR